MLIISYKFLLGLTRELTKMTRRADLVDNLEEQINNLQTQYKATEQKYQTMLTVSLDIDNTFFSLLLLIAYLIS